MSKQKLSRPDSFSYSQQTHNEITSFKHKSQPSYKPWVKKPINKCLQNNLVYAMYLPVWFEDQEVINRVLAKVIKSDKYFGKYGAITTVISSFGDSQKNYTAGSLHLQSYITYSNQKEAAFAISAVNQITYESKVIRTTYGTNKICSNFGKAQKCTIRNCFYLHDQKDCINIQGPLKTDFEKQKFIAYQTVKKNLVHFIAKIQQSKQNQQNLSKNEQDSKCKRIHFPSIKQTIDILIAKNILSKAQYQYAYQQYLDSKKKMSSTVKNIVYIRYRTKPNIQPPPVKRTQSQIVQKIETQQSEEVKQKTPKVPRKKLQSQFLMRPILQSLDEDQEEKIQKQVDQSTPIKIKQLQSIGLSASLEALQIYWQWHDEKENHFDDQIQTQESQTASCSKESSQWNQGQHASVCTLENIPNNRKVSHSIPQQSCTLQTKEQQCLILNRLKEKISKNPLAKMSKFQFVPSTPSILRKTEYQKVTNIIRSNLVK